MHSSLPQIWFRGTIRLLALAVPLLGVFLANARGTQGKEKVSGVSKEDYAKIFLEAGDLPGWKKVQDSQDMGADPKDAAFKRLGGLRSGLVVWMTDKEPVQRIVDIRWVFPNAAAARAYVRDQVAVMSEKMPAVKNAPKFGDESHVFGGPQQALGMKTRSYIIIFCEGNVVIKFFQFEAADGALTPAAMAAHCMKITNRIKSVAR